MGERLTHKKPFIELSRHLVKGVDALPLYRCRWGITRLLIYLNMYIILVLVRTSDLCELFTIYSKMIKLFMIVITGSVIRFMSRTFLCFFLAWDRTSSRQSMYVRPPEYRLRFYYISKPRWHSRSSTYFTPSKIYGSSIVNDLYDDCEPLESPKTRDFLPLRSSSLLRFEYEGPKFNRHTTVGYMWSTVPLGWKDWGSPVSFATSRG